MSGSAVPVSIALDEAVATELAAHDIATSRYQFPHMERGSKRSGRKDADIRKDFVQTVADWMLAC